MVAPLHRGAEVPLIRLAALEAREALRHDLDAGPDAGEHRGHDLVPRQSPVVLDEG